MAEYNYHHMLPIMTDTDPELSLQEKTALANFEKFHNLQPGTGNLVDVKNSSAGIEGWVNYTPYTPEMNTANTMMTTLG